MILTSNDLKIAFSFTSVIVIQFLNSLFSLILSFFYLKIFTPHPFHDMYLFEVEHVESVCFRYYIQLC